MAALLTGGSGFLGARVASALAGAGADLVFLRRANSDLMVLGDLAERFPSIEMETPFLIDPSPLRRQFDRHGVDGIVHLATTYGRAHETSRSLVETNVLLPLCLVEAGRGMIRYVLNAGTALPASVSSYALSKEQARQWLEAEAFGLCIVHAALQHFYGPGPARHNFVSRVAQALVAGEPEIPLTRGTQKRDFVYIDDVAAAFQTLWLEAAKGDAGFRSFDIGSGSSVTVRELVERLAALTGNQTTSLAFGRVAARPQEPAGMVAELSAMEALGWKPMVSLDQGLGHVVEYCRAHNSRAHSS